MVRPDKISDDEFIVATEVAPLGFIKKHLNYDPNAANALRNDVVDVHSKAHPPKTEHQQKRKKDDPISIKEERSFGPASRQRQGRGHRGY